MHEIMKLNRSKSACRIHWVHTTIITSSSRIHQARSYDDSTVAGIYLRFCCAHDCMMRKDTDWPEYAHESRYLPGILEVLQTVDRNVLLLLKTNDCLRCAGARLGARATETHLVPTLYACM